MAKRPPAPAASDDIDTEMLNAAGAGHDADTRPGSPDGGPALEADTVIAVAAPPAVQRAYNSTPGPRALWLLVLVLLALWLLRLGAAPLIDVDEGAFSEATREMVASHDFGHTTLNGADRFDKPILVYWLQSASVALLGVNEFAVRLPSALCGFGWCLALALFAWRRLGPAAAIASAAVLATSIGPMLIGRAATADALLNLLLTLAALDIWRHLEGGDVAPRRRAFAWIGLGLLAKGPVAFLVPAAAAGLWLLIGRDRSRAQRLVGDARAWGLMLLIAVPWYAYALHRHGWAFIDGFLVKHNLDRYSGSLEGHAGSLFYYFLLLPLLMLPWTALLWPMARQVRTRWHEPLGRYLLGWLAFVLVFFSFSGTKLPHYVLYGFTPLVLLAAQALTGLTKRLRAVLCGTMVLLSIVGGLSPSLAHLLGSRTHDLLYQTLLTTAPGAAWAWLLVPVVALVFALSIWIPNIRHYLTEADGALSAGAVLAAWLVLAVLPWWGDTLQSPIRTLARTVPIAQLTMQDKQALVQWRLHQPSVGFYAGQPVPRREPQGGDWALTRVDRLEPGDRDRLEVVQELRGYALVRPATAASEPLSLIGSARAAAEEAAEAASAAAAAAANPPAPAPAARPGRTRKHP